MWCSLGSITSQTIRDCRNSWTKLTIIDSWIWIDHIISRETSLAWLIIWTSLTSLHAWLTTSLWSIWWLLKIWWCLPEVSILTSSTNCWTSACKTIRYSASWTLRGEIIEIWICICWDLWNKWVILPIQVVTRSTLNTITCCSTELLAILTWYTNIWNKWIGSNTCSTN